MRHRLRVERAEVARQASSVALHDKRQLSGDEEECEDGGAARFEPVVRFTVHGKEYRIPTKSIQLLDVALDKRPGVPLLVRHGDYVAAIMSSPSNTCTCAHIHTHSLVQMGSSVWC